MQAQNGANNIAGRKIRSARDGRMKLDFPALQPNRRLSQGIKPRVAVILDDFSAQAWGYEWDCIDVKPDTWLEELSGERADLLFVESAWAGNGKAWSYHLTGSSAPRPAIVELLQWCKSQQIPTVFWNKEDPPHYEDFLATARLFDTVLTSDSTQIDRYKADLGHERVEALSFAAQPVVHNPVRPQQGFHARDVAFAGMYFAHKFPERREQMEMLLSAALDVSGNMEHGLEIFSRQLGGDANYQFPAPFNDHVVGSLPYEKMLTAYKAYKVFLNVNSVVDSPSMCARRIFEITASGTPVVTAPSRAIAGFFDKSEVLEVGTRKEAAGMIRSLVRSKELRDRTVHLGQRRIWQEHTYAHRAEQVSRAAGIGVTRSRPSSMTEKPKISALVSTIRPQQIDHILTTVGKQQNVDTELVLLSHGFELDERAIRSKAHDHGIENLVLLRQPRTTTLGACLNLAAGAASGFYVTKMDDDDLYGAHYLQDQAAAHRYSGANVVGKQAHYMYLGGRQTTLLRFEEREHRFTDMVMGPTIFTTREMMQDVPFLELGRGEDTNFLRGILEVGGTIYSSDRFNFVQMRGADGEGHTWSAEETELLATGVVSSFGLNEPHIMF
ncbi:glycosyltransferase family protein [Paeniglutamicibacter gangotriensis]|uniref:glycosyltransferase family protein n=1 Tax=Paeniglutamicibacter gangotriensis TaxID=254787 RepID=UPI0021D3A107|nr:glycosyltransferase [Paeniglutamicibacter gangotriensis]